ncbi:PREDICTED: uncharacterized protein LOC105362720 [Ceratosolen solmsi marchali]|uniref:Uncharacterized protein LOC105362720 n=1 Tax=Ceratosolen solmsi marchali TaxID=326594 RepID=A0AAJ7DW20_9HYME|nr:PREDICTED: uncharacterized protein LOC105362720 [Ceratosolen solmsi marchali]
MEIPSKQISDKTPASSAKSNLSKRKSKEDASKTVSNKHKDNGESSKQCSKSPCLSKDAVSEIPSFRRHSNPTKVSQASPRKDFAMKTELETVTITKTEKHEEVTIQGYDKHMTKQSSECESISATLRGEKEISSKQLEYGGALMDGDCITSTTSLLTSKIDLSKSTVSVERKEVKSSVLDTKQEKIISCEEMKDVRTTESSASVLVKKSPDEDSEGGESTVNQMSVNASHTTLVNVTESTKIIQSGLNDEQSIRSTTSLENDEKIVLTEETSSSSNVNVIGMSIKLEREVDDINIKDEDRNEADDTCTRVEESTVDNLKCTVDVTSPDARDNTTIKHQPLESGAVESECFQNVLADNLTWKFESIMEQSGNIERDVDSANAYVDEKLSDDKLSSDVIMCADGNVTAVESKKIANKPPSLAHNVTELLSSMDEIALGSGAIVEGKFISELSGARVLEILEPENDSVETIFLLDDEELSKNDDEALRESLSIDSLSSINKGLDAHSLGFAENNDNEYFYADESRERGKSNVEDICVKRRGQRDSFEIESPPLVSPRSKIMELEIKPVDWMIGDEKIEVSEQLQPYEAFEKELEEYESTIRTASEESDAKVVEAKALAIPRIEKTNFELFDDEENIELSGSGKSKFTVVPVSEQDIEIERELVENELDVSCQELMETLQKEHDARTPRYSLTDEMYAKSFQFRTVDEDEDILTNAFDRFEKLKLSDVAFETKTAVNVIENEEFMSVDEYFQPLPSTSEPTTDGNLMELYEENFETSLQIKNERAEGSRENEGEKGSSVEELSMNNRDSLIECMNFGNEIHSEEIVDLRNESLDKYKSVGNETSGIVEKPVELIDLMKMSDTDGTSINKAETLPDRGVEGIVESIDTFERDNANNKQNWSYNLENFQDQPVPSELMLKTELKSTELEAKHDNVELLSYKVFDPEERKEVREPREVHGIQKPPRTDIHRDGKFDFRSKVSDDHKRMSDKREKLHMSHQEISPYKMKKEDFQNVDACARYGIKVLDQVVKKEIAEVKENLEAAKQDLIEELSENSDNVIQIKDSPSEFQFKLQPESIPNELPFLYKAPSLDKVMDTDDFTSSPSSPSVKPREYDEITREIKDESSPEHCSAEMKTLDDDQSKTMIIVDSESEDKSSYKDTKESVESLTSSSKAATRVGSDPEVTSKDETFSLQPPQPVPRRRQKSSQCRRRHFTSESEADVSSSGESNYQSCEYESGSRPCSSDVEALQSAAQASSTTASEYESAIMSLDHSSSKALTSQDYHTAVSSMSSRESVKSLNSISSGQMGSIDSELSETLIASEPEMDGDEIDENLENILDDDTKISNYTSEDEIEKSHHEFDSDIPCMMKRSSEMIFSQVINTEQLSKGLSSDIRESDGSLLSTSAKLPLKIQLDHVDFTRQERTNDNSTARSTISQVIFNEENEAVHEPLDEPSSSPLEQIDGKGESSLGDADSLEIKHTPTSSIDDENTEDPNPNSGLSLQQQLSMTSSSMSGVSLETVIEKEHADRNSDSDSFELVDKPDLIDDFIVVEEVGREAEEFDAEGKGVRITSASHIGGKSFDREIENLVAERQEDQKSQAHSAHSNADLFDFESEESPPQASNDDQYSQSCSDDEQYNEGSKKWMEMQFRPSEARFYEMEYERGPLEDIKEEEVTDFEAGSSRFGSIGSQKESIGSIGSMRGSFGSTPDNYEALMAKRYFKPTDHDNISLSSLQEFEHLESAVALENAKKRDNRQSGSQDSSSNGSLSKKYIIGKSGLGDDVSLSSVKDFEVLEKACREAHMIELRAREEEDLLDHESPENRYKLENLARAKIESQGSAPESFNPSTSGSDDYEKRIKEIDEIIRLAQANVEKIDKQDDTNDDISQMELTDAGDKSVVPPAIIPSEASVAQESAGGLSEMNVMETSTDSLELEGRQNYNVMCRSSDSLELKTTLDYPSLSSDSLNNFKDPKEEQDKQCSIRRRISSDSLETPVLESQDTHKEEKGKDRIGES